MTEPVAALPIRANWTGRTITTTSNPQLLAPFNSERNAWRAYTLGGGAASGKIGYTSNSGEAYIPMPADGTYPAQNDTPVERNELWFHGTVGSVIGFAEC